MRISIGAKPFLSGLLVVGLAYLLIAFYAWYRSDATQAGLENMLASVAVPIAYVAPPEPEAIETPLPAIDLDALASFTDEPLEVADTPPAEAAPAPAPEVAGEGLTPAPIAELNEKSTAGPLPQKSGLMTPFEGYKRPFAITGKPVIALVVDDYGLSAAAAQRAIDLLPAEVTFMLSPYANDLQPISDKARASGHEVWMKVNFETAAYPHSDPGPQALLANASLKYNEDRLVWTMARASGYAGIAGSTDYIFDSASSILQPLIKSVYKRGLGFLETNPDASSLIEALAVGSKAPYAATDEHVAGLGSLTSLERIAQERGYAIGIIKPYEANFSVVKTWADGLGAKGISLAPVSAIAGLQLDAPGDSEETVEEATPAATETHDEHH